MHKGRRMFQRFRHKISYKYLALTVVLVVLVFGTLSWWICRRHAQLIIEQVEKQARILYRQVVLTRQWVSDHGYILVPDSEDGKAGRSAAVVYTRITPAGLTRRLSRRARHQHLYAFSIANFNGLNPENRPDAFESRALCRFCKGDVDAASSIEVIGGRHYFRYAAPLVVRPSCLACHHSAKYHVGGIGGCISVSIPFENAYRAIAKERLITFASMTALALALIGGLFFFARRMIFNPISQIRNLTAQIRQDAFDGQAVTCGDELRELSGLCSRLDEKLKSSHRQLQRKVAEATRDLSQTNCELMQANEELQALNAAKVAFFSDISHELRTPLTAIKGAADILARKASCNDPAYIDIIRKNSDHLIHTIFDLLDFSRIEAGHLELDRQPADMVQLAGEAISALQAEAAQKKLAIHLDAPQSAMLVMDRHRIYQVLSNLLANAVKFSPPNSRIRVAVTPKELEIGVCVSDQGPGIARQYQRAVFKKFFQVPGQDASGSLCKGSSGIGLAICRALVEAHGGRIWLESSLGRGSRFAFVLPREQGKTGPRVQHA